MIETKFKNTEIGRIPEDWEVRQLGELLTVCNGRDYKHLGFGPVPVYGTGGVVAWVDDYLYDGETVCIGRKGTIDKPQYHTGKIWTIDTLFYTRNFSANPLFLYYKCTNVNWNLINEATGVPSLTSQNIENVKISLPPTKEEQSRIASALFDIDTLICDLDRTIEKKQNIRQGAMEQLLSGKSDWVECELSEIINVVKGVQLNGSELLEDGPYPMINGGIEPSGYTTNFNRNAETITISEGGNSCGYVNFIHQKFWAGGHCYCVVVRKNVEIEKDFLYHLLKNNEKAIMAMRVGSGLPNVQSKTLLAMRVSYPADIKEQRAIADSLTAMDDEIAMLQLERTKYANIRSGMMDDLLSGTKRL